MLEPLYDKERLEEGIVEALRHIEAFDDIEKAKECLRTALSPNEKWALNLLNASNSEGMKFHTMNNYTLPFIESRLEKPKRSENPRLCVVYQVWGNHNYLKFLYLSVLSQIAYTDILDYDIKIFLGKGFVNDVGSSILERLLPEGSVIPVNDGLSLKYGLTTHPHLQNYDVVSVIDTDAFWYHPQGKRTNVYAKMLELYDSGFNGLIMAPDPDLAKTVFWQRRDTLNSNIPAKHYVEYFTRNANTDIDRLTDFIEGDKDWFLSCLFVYGKDHFKEPEYAKYAMTCLYDELLCDETVWMMWGMGHDYEITGMDETGFLRWVGAHNFDEYWLNRENEDSISYIHPVQGDHCYNLRIQELYDAIVEDYSKNIKKNDSGFLTKLISSFSK
jgi:hypothetical protein